MGCKKSLKLHNNQHNQRIVNPRTIQLHRPHIISQVLTKLKAEGKPIWNKSDKGKLSMKDNKRNINDNKLSMKDNRRIIKRLYATRDVEHIVLAVKRECTQEEMML